MPQEASGLKEVNPQNPLALALGVCQVSPQMTVKIGDMQTTRGHNGVVYIKGPAHIKLKCTRRHLINPESIKNRNIQYWEMDFEALEWSGEISVK